MGNTSSRTPNDDPAISEQHITDTPNAACNDERIALCRTLNIDITQKYCFTSISGEYTVPELVAFELAHDDRYRQLRKRELPPEFWLLWRAERNRSRTRRHRERRREKAAETTAHWTEADHEAHLRAVRAAGVERARRLDEGFLHGMKVVVDCSFASSAGSSEKEIRSLVRQLAYCIGANRRVSRPASLIFAGFTGALRELALTKWNASSWKAHLEEENAKDVISPGSNVIVLSPDADLPLESVDLDTVYVIGGLVDRTVKKGVSKSFAEDAEWPTRRLPLQEYLGITAVLNVNDVVGALLLASNGQGLKDALEEVVPQRLRQPKNGGKTKNCNRERRKEKK